MYFAANVLYFLLLYLYNIGKWSLEFGYVCPFGRRQVSGKERSMAKDMINNGINAEDKSRMIQEYVPGKQITLAHMVTRRRLLFTGSWGFRMITMMPSAL